MTLSINNYILVLTVIVSIYFDITQKKIPNFITFPVILWGLLTYTIFGGFEGFLFSGLGFLVGLGIFLILFILGVMGGGDLKLMAAIGALKGWKFVLYTSLYTAFVGGIIVIIWLIYKKQLLATLKRVAGIILKPILFMLSLRFNNELFNKVNNYFLSQELTWEKNYIPYGVAIGIGAVLVYII
ncbi:prepilin peptidase [Tissierella creatinini]|nr:prepilin peptidase [Tissierella creatinini]TJX61508.1 prepilin peptidase [Soehngenia saccharolytica]